MVNVQLPNAASLERTDAVCTQVEEILAETPRASSPTTRSAASAFLNNTFGAELGVVLRAASGRGRERKTPDLQLPGRSCDASGGSSAAMPEAVAFPFMPPTIPGFGAAGGFNSIPAGPQRHAVGRSELGAQTKTFLAAARQAARDREPRSRRSTRTRRRSQVELDREKAATLGVPINDVFSALQTCSRRHLRQRLQPLRPPLPRLRPGRRGVTGRRRRTSAQFYVRSKTTNEMIPLSTLVTVDARVPGTELTARFNLLRSVEISGSDRARATRRARRWPRSRRSRTRCCRARCRSPGPASRTRRRRRRPRRPTFVLAVVFVFLLLAAMYE